MAADRQRLAQALAAEAARRKMFESIPEAAGQGLPQAPEATNYGRDLENLSIGLGRGAVNQLEGMRQLAMHPVESAKGIAAGVAEAVRNPKMIAEALKKAGERATRGPLDLGEMIGENMSLRPRGPVMHEIDVYHGSPHKFEAFDASKIGTGEGAQAYGHGIYLAENPDIAKGYRDRLQRQGKIDSTGQLDLMMEKSLPKVQGGYEVKGVIYPYHKDLIEGISQGLIKKGDIPDDLYNAAKSYTEPGAFYHADLPDPMVERMLDWDKPLSEQPHIAKLLGIDESSAEYKMTGGDFYGDLGRQFGATGIYLVGPAVEKTSAELRDLGIPGIRYLDAGSRGQGGTGTRNFVVFPGEETKVKILKRE
jgi:hypothetical protein